MLRVGNWGCDGCFFCGVIFLCAEMRKIKVMVWGIPCHMYKILWCLVPADW